MSKFLKSKPRLGRGLSSLMAGSDLPVERELAPPNIPIADNEPTNDHLPGQSHGPPVGLSAAGVAVGDGGTLHLSPASVVPNPHQPRRRMNDSSIAELAASLK